jgi:hypothetical protein
VKHDLKGVLKYINHVLRNFSEGTDRPLRVWDSMTKKFSFCELSCKTLHSLRRGVNPPQFLCRYVSEVCRGTNLNPSQTVTDIVTKRKFRTKLLSSIVFHILIRKGCPNSFFFFVDSQSQNFNRNNEKMEGHLLISLMHTFTNMRNDN